jgi:hypothetical protein
MMSLDEAWEWYSQVRKSLQSMARLAWKHWNSFDDDHPLFRDEPFKQVTDVELWYGAEIGLRELQDQAILMLFSSFEVRCRHLLQAQVSLACSTTASTAALSVLSQSLDLVQEGSFAQVAQHFHASGTITENMHQQLGVLREYRNWLAHGRSGRKPGYIEPRVAYQQLSQVLQAIKS